MPRTQKTPIAAALLAAGLTGYAGLAASFEAARTDLLFSEYIEGTSNNKALELYNGTAAAIDLAAAGYLVQMYFNGSTSAGLSIPLTGILDPGGVFVLANASADAAILAQADQTNGSGWYNGDDAVVLLKGGASGAVVDSIGQVGLDPGTEWGTGLTSTADNTLRRRSTVLAGDTDPFDAFDPALEWDGFATNTFDDLGVYGVAPPPPPPPTLARIHAIQGDGLSSPLVGTTVTVEAIVVGDFQNNGQPDSGDLRGFYLQEADADADANPATSEGIFVFESSPLVDVVLGDRVRVVGRVSEFNGLTQISAEAVTVLATGVPLPAATPVAFPVASRADLERYEGMRVILPQALTVAEYFNFDRFGEVVLALPLPGEDRPITPTNIEVPGSPEALARADLNARSRITLDDGFTVQNPDPVRHPNGADFTLANRFRGGDTVANVLGILDERFGLYRIQPTAGADHVMANSRPLPPLPQGRLTVASFNVLNYFTTLDNGGPVCGPAGNLECRGADTPEEFQRQRAKIVSALVALDADLVGLIEFENDAGTALADLVAGLNDATGPDTYGFVDTGFIGTDAIKGGFLYKTATVRPEGPFAILDASVNPRFLDQKNRPALAQTFTETATGARFTAAVNHFKSKGSPCDDVGDPDLGDGQGNCNGTRTEAAVALADWLATDPTGSGDPDFLILGDLNAYAQEDPIAVLRGLGYTDLIWHFQGPAAYTFVFDGQVGYLDHALANESLLSQVTGTTPWAINADEPDILDYDLSFKGPAQAALFEPNEFRSSDHDPVLVGLDLKAPPVCDGARPSVDVLWPPNQRLQPVEIQGVSDPQGDPVRITIAAVFQDEPVVGRGDPFAPDATGVGTETVKLRAQRASGPRANGRVYHVQFNAESSGGSCSGEVRVSVPMNQGRRTGAAVDDGPLFDSTRTD